jgi:hypothetical protein
MPQIKSILWCEKKNYADKLQTIKERFEEVGSIDRNAWVYGRHEQGMLLTKEYTPLEKVFKNLWWVWFMIQNSIIQKKFWYWKRMLNFEMAKAELDESSDHERLNWGGNLSNF